MPASETAEVSWLDLPRKKCSACGYAKLLDCFAISADGKGGRESRCRECRSQQGQRRWLQTHPDARRKYEHAYKIRRVIHVT